MHTEALWSPERLGLLPFPWEGRSLQLHLVPMWLKVSAYEWLAGACEPWPRLWVSEDHRQKGY